MNAIAYFVFRIPNNLVQLLNFLAFILLLRFLVG